MKVKMILLAALPLFSSSILAADVDAGKSAAAACQGCHGPDGNSPNPIWPSLAGQQANYIQSQLEAFKAGTRKNAMMQGFAASLSDSAMANIAAYYSSLEPKVPAGVDEHFAQKGKGIYVGTCVGCHGADAKGSDMYPGLAAQQVDYTVNQLKAFKSGDRSNPMMQAMVGGLSEDDMKAVAAYVATLP